MIEDQSRIEGRRTERAIANGPAFRDFLNAVSVGGSPSIFAATPDATRVAMYFHGADWVLGALDMHRRLVRDIANGARAVAAFVDHHRSLDGHYRTAFEEVYEVTEYVVQIGEEFNIDPTRLVIASDGVGGNMFGAVSLFTKEPDDSSIRFQLLVYAVIDGEGGECPHNLFAE